MRATLCFLLSPFLLIGCLGDLRIALGDVESADDDDNDASDDDDSAETIPSGPVWPDDGGGGDDPGAAIFDWSEVPEFHLELSDDAIDFLHEDYLDFNVYDPAEDPFEYTTAIFRYNDLTYEPVGVRLKGQNSARDIYDKAAFKIRFNWSNPDGRFLGLKSITLNNMVSDYSMMHERIAYRLYREAGLCAARANHAALYINGDYYGLFTLLDSVGDQLLERDYEDPSGSLFEGWDVDFYDYYIPSYQHEEGVDDRTALYGLADALQISGPEGLTAAEEFVDWDQFRRWWAIGAMVAQFDGYPYSNPGDDYHVYVEPITGQLHFLPHGLDECFYYDDHPVDSVNGIVASRCVNDAECREIWEAEIFNALDLADEAGWADWYTTVQAQIEPLVEADDRKPYNNYQVTQYQGLVESIITNRRAQMEGQLNP